MPDLFIIGGPDGAGKTTTAMTLFPRLGITEFVNADAIASGLSPLNPEGQARAAGRLMIRRMEELRESGQDFALETTLASRSLLPFLLESRERGYSMHVIYVWLESSDLAVQRVAKRVASGGHSIPEETIRRRYSRGRLNFLELYKPIANRWFVLDNSGSATQHVAEGGLAVQEEIYLPKQWMTIVQGSAL